MCFTRTRSPVRTRQETKLFFCPDIIFAPWQARYDICKIWYLDTKNKIDTVHTVTQTFMIFAYFEYLGYKSRFYGVMVSTLDFESSDPSSNLGRTCDCWLRGATVARLTPDQKAACSNHVGVIKLFCFPTPSKLLKGGGPTKNIYFACLRLQKSFASNEDWTHDLWFTRPTLCHWAIEAFISTSVKILTRWMQQAWFCFFYLPPAVQQGSMV